MKRWSTVLIAFAAVAVVVVALQLRGPSCDGYRFDSSGWRASGVFSEGKSQRQRAGERLAECDGLRGKGRDAVRALLGAPIRDQTYGSDSWLVGADDLGDTRSLLVEYSSGGAVRRVSKTGAAW